MIDKLIEQAKKLSECKKQRDSREDHLNQQFIRFSNLISSIWKEHSLNETTFKVKDSVFLLSDKGCKINEGTISFDILQILEETVLERIHELQDKYNQEFVK